MAQSFTPKGTHALPDSCERCRRSVLVTGAAGNIGSYFAEHSHMHYDLRLMVREMDEDAEKVRGYGEVVEGDITDLDRMKEVCGGMDTVLHLAADARPDATWDNVRDLNITGTYNVFVGAKSAGCRRVIFASSIHAVSGHPADVQVKTGEPVNPGDLYGVSKCFGEALARYMAEQEGLSALVLRIGAFQPADAARRNIALMDAWVSRRDLNQLIEDCIDVENLQFAILHGLSRNRFNRMDISDTRELVGYDPQDDATEEHEDLRDLDLREKVSAHNVQDPGMKSGLRKEL